MVSNQTEYKWSSYLAFIGKQKKPQFLQTDWLLANYKKNKRDAKRHYKDFVEGADPKTLENPNRQVTQGSILWDTNFLNRVKNTFLSSRQG